MISEQDKNESFFDKIELVQDQDYQIALEIEENDLQLVKPLTLEAYLMYGLYLENHWEDIDTARHALGKYNSFVLINANSGTPVCYIEMLNGDLVDSETIYNFSMFGRSGEELLFAQHRKSYFTPVYTFLKENGLIEKSYLKRFKEVTTQEFEYKQKRVTKFLGKIMESEDAELFKKFLRMNRYDLGLLIQDCIEISWSMELVFMDQLTHFFMDAFWRGKGVYIEYSSFNSEEFKSYPDHIIKTIKDSYVPEPRLKLIPTSSNKKPANHAEIIKAAESLEQLQLERSGGSHSKSGDSIDYLGTKNIEKIKLKHNKK